MGLDANRRLRLSDAPPGSDEDTMLDAVGLSPPRFAQSPAAPSPTPDYLPLLRLCSHLSQARQVHAVMLKSGQIADPYAAARVAELYAVSGLCSPACAEKLLFSLSSPPTPCTTFMYNTTMRGHLLRGEPLRSLRLCRRMLRESVRPDCFTFTFALKAATRLAVPGAAGGQLHAQALRRGLDSSAYVRNKLIHLYAVCGAISEVRNLFDGSSELDGVAWNTMLRGYATAGDGTTLRHLFGTMPSRDAVSWNTLIAFYAEIEEYAEAVSTFRMMQENGEEPDRVTLVSVLSALAQLGALGQGKWVHAYIQRHHIEIDENLCSSLINMYAKCGCIEGAVYAFEDASQKSSVDVWNALLSGFAANGHSQRALELFYRMEDEGILPNAITFSCIMNACSHGGLIEEGAKFFEKMTDVYGIEPDIAHCGCLVDLFCRAGLFRRAEEIICQMPMEPDTAMWKAVLGACRVHGNFELGVKVGVRLVKLDPDDNAGYVLLSNIYAMADRWDKVYKIRKIMKKRKVKKVPGCSTIELDGSVHEFKAGDESHFMKEEIYRMLDEMERRLKLAGYKPDTEQVLIDVNEEMKESSLLHHSEKLAIAYALISTRPGMTIRIVKNLRICVDCHSALKLLSCIYNRDIIVRDSNRFHHFQDGSCTCRDFW